MASVDCSLLASYPGGVLANWGYSAASVPADAASNCCNDVTWTNGAIPVVTCGPTGNIITLNLTGVGLVGQIPTALQKLTSLQTLFVQGDKQLAGTIPSLPTAVTCNFANTNLCLSSSSAAPKCISNVNTAGASSYTIPVCGSSSSGNSNAQELTVPTASTYTWIIFGVAIAFLLTLLISCIICARPGPYSKDYHLEQTTPLTKSGSISHPSSSNNAALNPSPSEMAVITLTRNGAPKRSFSLAEQRDKEGVLEADVEACVPFMKVNTPASSPLFPVRRAYMPVLADEMTLVVGDTIRLLRVFRDGWAEGVSMTRGGPLFFPIACLGGGVPLVLSERLRLAQAALAARTQQQMHQDQMMQQMQIQQQQQQQQQQGYQGGYYVAGSGVPVVGAMNGSGVPQQY